MAENVVPPQPPADPENNRQVVDIQRVLQLLEKGTLDVQGLLPYSSNYTFLTTITHDDLTGLAVYKPRKGERPLWDFPRGTLCQREVASYLVSEALGWHLVPPTVLRKGPQGLGMVQLYIDHDPEAHFFTFREAAPPEIPRIALFDALVNNADRKGGHCLQDESGRIWCIDHGLTFHAEPKLRTVIWDFAGETIPAALLADLGGFQRQLCDKSSTLAKELAALLSAEEMSTLEQRLSALIQNAIFPLPGNGRHVPWPMI